MVPKAIKDVFHAWASEVMNQGVHVHSKVIVDRPIWQEPSRHHRLAQFGLQSVDQERRQHDDRGRQRAARRLLRRQYHRHLSDLSLEHLRRRSCQRPAGVAWPCRQRDLAGLYLKPGGGDLAEIKFWLGEGASAGAPAAAPAPGGTEVRAATASGPSRYAKQPSRSGPSAKKAPAKKGKPKAAGGSAKPTASKRKAAPAKRTPAKSRRTTVKKAPAKTRRAPAKKAPPKSRMARMKSTRAAAARRASGKIASRTPRRSR